MTRARHVRGLPGVRHRFWYGLFLLLWLLALVAAGWRATRPPPLPPLAAGWQRWLDTGALYALLPYGDGMLAGGAQGLWLIDAKGRRRIDVRDGQGLGDGRRREVGEGQPSLRMVTSLVSDPDGGLWLGFADGIARLRDGRWRVRQGLAASGWAGLRALALSDGRLWLGTDQGLGWLPTGDDFATAVPTRVTAGGRLPAYQVARLWSADDGALWIGTDDAPAGGVYRYAAGRVLFWGQAQGLPHPQVTAIRGDRQGRVWVATGFFDRGGVAIFAAEEDGWRLSRRLTARQLAGPKARSLYHDSRGRHWIGSENDGLVIRDERRVITTLGPEQGLPGREVTAIMEGLDGAIWIAGLKGLVRIERSALPVAVVEEGQ